MKWQALLLSFFGFGLLAAAGFAPDPDACGDPAMPPPVKKISCGTWLEDLGCKWDSDFVSCIQTCRRQKGMNRLIYHNHRYYDISVAEYDRIMRAEENKSAHASEFTVTATTTKTVAALKATKKAGVHHTSKKTSVHHTSKKTGVHHTSKKTASETVFRTITHVARQPAVETAAQTSSDLWWTHTKAIEPSAPAIAAHGVEALMPPPVEHISCGNRGLDLACGIAVEESISIFDEADEPILEYISCIQSCRHRHGLQRLIYHNGHYYDMPLAEYEELLDAERFASARASKTATAAARTNKETGFKTVFRTVTHVARQPSIETGLVAPHTTYTKVVGPSATTGVADTHVARRHEVADSADEDETSHPRLDLYCAKTSQVAKCRVKCA